MYFPLALFAYTVCYRRTKQCFSVLRTHESDAVDGSSGIRYVTDQWHNVPLLRALGLVSQWDKCINTSGNYFWIKQIPLSVCSRCSVFIWLQFICIFSAKKTEGRLKIENVQWSWDSLGYISLVSNKTGQDFDGLDSSPSVSTPHRFYRCESINLLLFFPLSWRTDYSSQTLDGVSANSNSNWW